MRRVKIIFQSTLLITILVVLFGCLSSPENESRTGSRQVVQPSDTPLQPIAPIPTVLPKPIEVEVQIIPLAGPAAELRAEISGMAWYGDDLILLPQFPDRFDQNLFRLSKNEILAYIQGETDQPLTPEPVPLVGPNYRQEIKGYEGFESVTFHGNLVYLTIESHPDQMLGYLVRGTISENLSQIILEPKLVEIAPQAPLENYSDESILIFDDSVFTFFEANGKNVNPSPTAHLFSLTGKPETTVPFPNIEYRITDATSPDSDGIFWAINYFFPLDQLKLKPAEDMLAEKYGRGPTHSQDRAVERLVAFRIYDHQRVELVDVPPVQLRLDADLVSRNWEALAVFDDLGFLIATDKFPQTLFGFVPWNSSP